jgi:hypothetical protein
VGRPIEVLLLAGELIDRQETLQRGVGAFLVLAAGVERAAPVRLAHRHVPRGKVLGGLDCRLPILLVLK